MQISPAPFRRKNRKYIFIEVSPQSKLKGGGRQKNDGGAISQETRKKEEGLLNIPGDAPATH